MHIHPLIFMYLISFIIRKTFEVTRANIVCINKNRTKLNKNAKSQIFYVKLLVRGWRWLLHLTALDLFGFPGKLFICINAKPVKLFLFSSNIFQIGSTFKKMKVLFILQHYYVLYTLNICMVPNQQYLSV